MSGWNDGGRSDKWEEKKTTQCFARFLESETDGGKAGEKMENFSRPLQMVNQMVKINQQSIGLWEATARSIISILLPG